MKKATEPSQLRRGKAFHRRIQAEWLRTAEGQITTEKAIQKPSGADGRIDIHTASGSSLVGVVELKASNWDRMPSEAVRRSVARQARQIWSYIDSQLAVGKEVSPGIIYPHMPRALDRRNMIESLLEAEGISVVWQNETIPDRKNRSEKRQN